MAGNTAFKPIIRRPTKKFYYKRLFQWQQQYARRYGNDKSAIDNCLENESAEFIRILKTELTAISRGLYDDDVFDKHIGVDRKKKHKSYMAWAKHMLVLIASYKG